jgi:TetR/AcrR family transcriptional repressor of nem operon
MRYPATHKQDTRARLLKTTGALAKRQGFAGTGVDGLMAAAGLTSGAFYSHFRSKGELLEAIVQTELQRSGKLFSGKSRKQLLRIVEGYLSPAHVAQPESGCAIPALAGEVARANDATRQAFEQGVVALKDSMAAATASETRRRGRWWRNSWGRWSWRGRCRRRRLREALLQGGVGERAAAA